MVAYRNMGESNIPLAPIFYGDYYAMEVDDLWFWTAFYSPETTVMRHIIYWGA